MPPKEEKTVLPAKLAAGPHGLGKYQSFIWFLLHEVVFKFRTFHNIKFLHLR